jgi:hypothetical protein
LPEKKNFKRWIAMQNDKDALAQLRQERKEIIGRAKESIREQTRLIRAIKDHLKREAATVPELARDLGEDAARVLLFISGLRKYGQVVEGDKVDNYFTYKLVETDGETA